MAPVGRQRVLERADEVVVEDEGNDEAERHRDEADDQSSVADAELCRMREDNDPRGIGLGC
jgi:hypothetical protein